MRNRDPDKCIRVVDIDTRICTKRKLLTREKFQKENKSFQISPKFIRISKSGKFRRMGRVRHIRLKKNSFGVLVGKPE
jgi:hypothetical protein